MAATAFAPLRDQLLDRRQKLEAAAATLNPRDEVARLLQEVDAALGRMNAGTFGLCATCHDPIESDRLAADPLTQFCLDHLPPASSAPSSRTSSWRHVFSANCCQAPRHASPDGRSPITISLREQ
jgi:Prokaryotic dksA/traR C4-type zinc finger